MLCAIEGETDWKWYFL